MRATVDLDDDVVVAVREIQQDQGLGLSAAVNELARRGLHVSRPRKRFVQQTSAGHALVDPRNIGEVLAQLDEGERRAT